MTDSLIETGDWQFCMFDSSRTTPLVFYPVGIFVWSGHPAGPGLSGHHDLSGYHDLSGHPGGFGHPVQSGHSVQSGHPIQSSQPVQSGHSGSCCHPG